jgi:hypothetical protein
LGAKASPVRGEWRLQQLDGMFNRLDLLLAYSGRNQNVDVAKLLEFSQQLLKAIQDSKTQPPYLKHTLEGDAYLYVGRAYGRFGSTQKAIEATQCALKIFLHNHQIYETALHMDSEVPIIGLTGLEIHPRV